MDEYEKQQKVLLLIAIIYIGEKKSAIRARKQLKVLTQYDKDRDEDI